ncbi:MAG: MGMT family protein [Dehalococcoidia bacterium]|nr:MGMT family protein [Dehalococcoidia bacterium]
MSTQYEKAPVYRRILDVVRQVPHGQVATYGQIALIVGDCTPRMVGYCLASLDFDSDVPWQRIINYQGKVSPRSTGHGSQVQRELLENEGVEFDARGCVSFRKYGWMETE